MICNNPAKMPITSTSHEWVQIEQEATSMAVTSKNISDKPPQDHQQPLRCPRCDSSNTKFCYYNNYSLSQPRHFCKACKRYWTRGGTLRNVPVGGGCRKNKRVKRPAAVSSDTPTSLPIPSTGQSDNYIVARTPPNMASLPFPSLQSQLPSLNYEYLSIPRSSSSLDLPHHFSSLNWLNFPTGATHPSNNSDEFEYQQGSFTYNPGDQFHESMTSSSLWTTDHPTSTFLGSSSAPTDLLASTFNQQKLMNGLKEPARTNVPNGLQVLFPMGDHSNILKGVKMEEENPSMDNKMDWQVPNCNSSIHENISSSSNMNWNLAGVLGSWAEANAHGPLTPLL